MFINKISMSQTCLYNISYQKAVDFTTTSRYRGHSAILQHNTNFASVHSQVTVDSCSVEYEYKPLRQFTTMVGGTRCYLWLKQSQSNSLRGHTKHFCSYLGTDQSGSGWKATGYSKNEYPVTSQTNCGRLENFLSRTICVALQQCRTNR